jgi:uncharacterized membrane protein
VTSWVVYLNDVSVFFNVYPIQVQFIVVVLPLFFISFGCVASIECFQLALGQQTTEKAEEYMGAFYDTLSLFAKIPVVLVVWYSSSMRPNSGCDM